MQSPRPQHWFLLFLLVVLWGSRYAAVEVALVEYRPLDVVFLPLVIAGVMLWFVMRASGERLPKDMRSWLFFNAMALFGNGLPYFLEAWGQLYIESSLVGILMSVSPLSVLVLAHLLLPDERATRGRVLGFVVGLVGVIVLIGPSALSGIGGGVMRTVAQLAVLGAAVCYGLAAVITRLSPAHSYRIVSAGVLIAAALQLAPVWFLSGGMQMSPSLGEPTFAVIGVGTLCIGLAALVFFKLIGESGASFQSLSNYLTPLWATLIGYLLLDERLPRNAYLALGIILASLWLTARSKNRQSLPDPSL
ncbi:MAG: DMT family transporter [Pseudomonadota bacterium]